MSPNADVKEGANEELSGNFFVYGLGCASEAAVYRGEVAATARSDHVSITLTDAGLHRLDDRRLVVLRLLAAVNGRISSSGSASSPSRRT